LTARFISESVRHGNDLEQSADEIHLMQLMDKVLGDVEGNRPHQ